MSRVWPKVALGELAAEEDSAIAIGPFGSRMKADNYTESGIPVVRGQNLTDSGGLEGDFVFVSEEFAAGLGSSNLKEEDIVLPHRGAIGRVALVPAGRFLMSTSLMRIRVNKSKILPNFALYCLLSSDGRAEILKFASTVGTPGIGQPLTSLKQVRIPLPPLAEQRRIAGVLGALDDLIVTNQCVAIGLESLAQSLFDRLMSNSAASVGVTPLSSTVEVLSGGTPKTSESSYWGGGIPWFSVVDTPNDHEVWVFETSKSITEEGLAHSPARLLPIGSTILSARGTVGKTALVATPMAMNQSCYALRSLNGPRGFYNYFLTRSVVEELQQNAHGSVFDTITRATLDGVMVPDLASGQIIAFEDSVAPLLDQVLALLQENQQLAMARDELLPLLLAGRVSVREVAA